MEVREVITSQIALFILSEKNVRIKASKIPGVVRKNIWGAVTNAAVLSASP